MSLDRLRSEIAATDREILDLVNRRLELVGEIRRHKAENSIPFVDPDQEERLLRRLRDANPGPLSAEGVEQLFRELLELIKRESAHELRREGAGAANREDTPGG